jgi:hypothetical protein
MSRPSCLLSPCDCETAALNLKRAVEIPLGAAARQASPASQPVSVRETRALMLIARDFNVEVSKAIKIHIAVL